MSIFFTLFLSYLTCSLLVYFWICISITLKKKLKEPREKTYVKIEIDGEEQKEKQEILKTYFDGLEEHPWFYASLIAILWIIFVPAAIKGNLRLRN